MHVRQSKLNKTSHNNIQVMASSEIYIHWYYGIGMQGGGVSIVWRCDSGLENS